ncbi:MAG: sulfatase-like hydrolase/transferase [Rikenellaceae bacterium]
MKTDKLLILSTVTLAACAVNADKITTKPNVLIIYTDDMGLGDLSIYNNGWAATPCIDSLAKEGIIFENYYSAAPVSSASRTGLLTGQYPLQWGINTFLNDRKMNREAEQFDYLDSSAPSMARMFKDNGYYTTHIGKWHLGGGRDVDDAPSIKEYGYDSYLSTWESPDPDPVITSGDWIWKNEDSVKRWNRTSYFVDKVLLAFETKGDKPVFVNFWPDDMHTPWVQGFEVQDSPVTWVQEDNFRAVLECYDREIGRLVDGLKEMGEFDNTIIVFTSDNGAEATTFSQQRNIGKRGHKNSLYEGGIAMPFFVTWANEIQRGGVDSTSVVTSMDLFLSLGAMAGLEIPAGYASSGEDMSKALLGEPTARTKDIMWDFGRNEVYARPKLAHNHSPHLAMRRGDWKLLMNSDSTRIELYNIAHDPNENSDVAAERIDIVNQMTAPLLQWWNTRKVRKD